jgi:hypothetical protein
MVATDFTGVAGLDQCSGRIAAAAITPEIRKPTASHRLMR